MSILENLSDLAHELRCAAGTVLTILGSRLEARERACVECGPQWLTEFEEQRDSLEPDGQLFECSAPTCGCHDDPRYQAFPAPEDSAVAAADPCSCGAGYTSAAECPWCREVGDCICWVGHGDCGGCSGVLGISHEPACGWQWDPSCPQHGDGLKASAASALAADPSSARPSPSPASAGVEGPGGASDIPQSAPPDNQPAPGAIGQSLTIPLAVPMAATGGGGGSRRGRSRLPCLRWLRVNPPGRRTNNPPWGSHSMISPHTSWATSHLGKSATR